jgi:hypothetical protein
MTEAKARKRAVRTRMAKTGERYTTARSRLLAKRSLPPKPPTGRQLPPRVAEPTVSDEAVKKATGCDWDRWFWALDAANATSKSHREIAAYISGQYGIGGWWAQTVTLGYERARGMRAPHQRSGGGGYSVSVSKTFPVDANRLFRAFTESRERGRWLEPGTLRTRTSQPGRTARFDVRDGARLHAYFTPKSETRASVHLDVEKLPDAGAVEEARAFWKERLARLGDAISS